MTQRLSTAQLMEALRYWSKGSDTLDISIALDVPESVVFNSLREARERLRVVRLEAVG
jgi:hypothetical protein